MNESFPFESVSDLSDEQVEDFVAENIWVSATYFWGVEFRNPWKIDENEDIYTTITAPDGEGTVSLSFFLDEDDEPGEGIDGEEPLNTVSVNIRMEVYRDDISEILPKNMRGYSFWEVTDYEFPVNGEDRPTVGSYYTVRDKKGNEVGLDLDQEELREKIEDMFELPYRNPDLNSQDCVDAHNILLTLGVPQEFISLH